MSRLRRILYVFVAVKGRSAIPPKASPWEHMLTFPLDSSPICSKTGEVFVFWGDFLEKFFGKDILIVSLEKYILFFAHMEERR